MIGKALLGEGFEIRPATDPEARAFFDSHPVASPYHDPVWWNLLALSFGYAPCVIAQVMNERIVSALPACVVRPVAGGRRLSALPFSHFVAPLAAEGGSPESMLQGLRRAAAALACGTIELKSPPPATSDFISQPALLHTMVPVAKDDASQLAQMKDSTRQQTAQGLKHPALDVAPAKSAADLRVSHRLISETRRRKGSLTYPRSLFSGLLPWIQSGHALVEVARLDGRAVATTVTLRRNKTAIYMYGGSLGDEASLRARPYNVLLFRALRFAREAGADTLDLGTSLQTQTGLVRFKEGLGGHTMPLHYGSWPRAAGRPEQDGQIARLAGAILSRLPLPVFELVTPLLMRQVG